MALSRLEREMANAKPIPDDICIDRQIEDRKKAEFPGQPGEGIHPIKQPDPPVYQKRIAAEPDPEKSSINPVDTPQKESDILTDKPIQASPKTHNKSRQDSHKNRDKVPEETENLVPRRTYIKTSMDVKRQLNIVYNELRQRLLCEKDSRAQVYCLKTMLECIIKTDFEERLEEIERQLNKGGL